MRFEPLARMTRARLLRLVPVAALLTLAQSSCARPEAPEASEVPEARLGDRPEATSSAWTELFNGRDLAGWIPKIRGEPVGQDARGTFRVEDGLLVVGYEGYDRDAGFDEAFGHLFYEAPLESYELLVEYRFAGEQFEGGPDWARSNSGVMFHAQDPATIGLDQDFPISLEVQFLGGAPGEVRPTANLCTPGTHVDIAGEQVTRHCVEAAAPTYLDGTWVTVILVARADGAVRHVIDGDTVLAYERPVVGGAEANGTTEDAPEAGTVLVGGWIALQSESHPIQFRRVAVRSAGVR